MVRRRNVFWLFYLCLLLSRHVFDYRCRAERLRHHVKQARRQILSPPLFHHAKAGWRERKAEQAAEWQKATIGAGAGGKAELAYNLFLF